MIIFIWLGRVRGRKGKRNNAWKKKKKTTTTKRIEFGEGDGSPWRDTSPERRRRELRTRRCVETGVERRERRRSGGEPLATLIKIPAVEFYLRRARYWS